MRFGLAHFPFVRDPVGFGFAAQPSIDKAQIRELATSRFIANGEAVLFTPATTPVAPLAKAHADGRLEERRIHDAKPMRLIVHELGDLPFEPDVAHLFFQLVSRRYEKGAMLVTSKGRQRPRRSSGVHPCACRGVVPPIAVPIPGRG